MIIFPCINTLPHFQGYIIFLNNLLFWYSFLLTKANLKIVFIAFDHDRVKSIIRIDPAAGQAFDAVAAITVARAPPTAAHLRPERHPPILPPKNMALERN